MLALKELAMPAIVLALLAGSVGLVYKMGKLEGVAETSASWSAENKLRDSAMNVLRGQLQQKEADHAKETGKITDELKAANEKHAADLAAVRADYAERLRNSEGRAGVYQRQARGSAAERDTLAEHAARLDASLEEGRQLVGELTATIRQRDRAIDALKKMILNDRTLLTESSEANGR